MSLFCTIWIYYLSTGFYRI